MSEITKKDVEHIAALARVRLDDEQKEKMARELGAILSYIDKLKEVDTEGVEAAAYITGMENILRKDEMPQKSSADQSIKAMKLVEMSPESKDNFVKVRAVFGE